MGAERRLTASLGEACVRRLCRQIGIVGAGLLALARAGGVRAFVDEPAKPTRIAQPTSQPALKSSKALEAILEPIRARHSVPGLAGAIVVGDTVTEIGAVGVRKAGSPERLTVNDRFHMGSCTKSMTATLIAMLVEQGRLSWTTTIADVFPDLRERMHPDFRSVTLEQLLSHRAGVPTDLSADGLWTRLWNHTGTPTQ